MTGAGVYQQYVYDFFFTTLPQGLASALTSGGTGTIDANSFDVVWMKAWRAGLEVWRTLSWNDFAEKIVVIVFWLGAIISTVFAFAIWLISRVLLALSIALGPLLIGLVLFPATRAIFERWIGLLIACVILQITTVVLLYIVLTVEQEVAGTVAAMGSVDPMVMIQVLLAGVVFFAVAGFVALQLPAVASSLAGGLHFHTGALARAARSVMGSTGRNQMDAQGNTHRVGRSGAAGAAHYTATVAGRGVSMAGHGVVAGGLSINASGRQRAALSRIGGPHDSTARPSAFTPGFGGLRQSPAAGRGLRPAAADEPRPLDAHPGRSARGSPTLATGAVAGA
jgi:type IV secretion system protein VirB6